MIKNKGQQRKETSCCEAGHPHVIKRKKILKIIEDCQLKGLFSNVYTVHQEKKRFYVDVELFIRKLKVMQKPIL